MSSLERRLEAIRDLSTLDHCFLGKEGVVKLTEPFGFVGSTYLARANPHDFKGLTLHDADGNAVDEMEGQDAAVVAQEIARHLGVAYQPMYGRGSQLRECCARVLEYLQK